MENTTRRIENKSGENNHVLEDATITNIFHSIDLDHNEVITLEEFQCALSTVGLKRQQAEKLFKKETHEKGVTLKDYKSIVKKYYEQKTDFSISSAFSLLLSDNKYGYMTTVTNDYFPVYSLEYGQPHSFGSKLCCNCCKCCGIFRHSKKHMQHIDRSYYPSPDGSIGSSDENTLIRCELNEKELRFYKN